MKGMQELIFIVIEVFLIAIFIVLVSRAVGAVFNPDKEVVILNTELLRSKINEACQFPGKEIELDKFALPQPKPSRIFGVTDFLPGYAISGSGAADPHYVLYYEAFPPGEAIGWEAYLRQDTRFIAPFDYSKFAGTDKLAKGVMISSETDIADFFSKMKEYEKSVIAKAESFTEAEFGEDGGGTVVSYIADEVPDKAEPSWEKKELNTGPAKNTVKTDKGEMELRTPIDGSLLFRRTETKSSEAVSMEVKMRVEEARKLGGWPWEDKGIEKIFISIHNAPFRADLIFREDKIILSGEAKIEFKIDAKKYHIYKLEIKSGEAVVYVDNEKKLSGKAKSSTETAFVFGSADPDDQTKGKRGSTESYWDYIKYAGTEIDVPDTIEAKSELAKKPVLINNIILSDSLNVIPTETPIPPGSGVANAAKGLGNAGEWKGGRFEFTDYFGLTKEDRAYIKYRACGDNALCLKTRDAVQAFPLDNACKNVQYIHTVYDARGMEWEDLAPAAAIAGETFILRKITDAQKALGKKAAAGAVDDVAKAVSKTPINLDALAKGTATEFFGDLDGYVNSVSETAKKSPGMLSKTIGKLGKFGKSALKFGGRKAIGKGPGLLKLALIADIFLHEVPDLTKNVMRSTLEYKDSEFYLASPCQLQEGEEGPIKITYEKECQTKEELCSEGITYPLYEYKVEFDGTKTIRNVGSHFMCLESIGKDKEEPEEYKNKYKTEISAVPSKMPEDVGCIKIEMKKVKRKDFCWTNNPILPEERGLWNKFKKFLPGKDELINAATGCIVGAAVASPTLVGALVACGIGAGTSLAVDEAGNALDVVGITNGGGLKGELFVRAGGLPVTEGTSYITYTEDDKADASKKYLEAVEMAPTDIIGGSAAKRFGEITKDFFEVHWAWPR